MRRGALGAVAMGVVVMATAPAPPGIAAPRAPQIRELIVFRDGSARQATASTRAVRLRVRGRRCVAGDATPLAALVRSRPGRLRLRDFGSCSLDARDAGGLFVSAIRGDRNRGQNGWVYKVGRRAGTAGAADASGPFGTGRLRKGQRVTWFYCRLRDGGCQRTLELSLSPEPGGLLATVRGYDDDARGVAVEGASVTASGVAALTDAAGMARLTVPPGRHRVVAEKEGMVRSFAERVEVP